MTGIDLGARRLPTTFGLPGDPARGYTVPAMILDTLPNLALYAELSPHLSTAAVFLATHDLAALPAGRVEIDGDDVFATVSDYDTHAPEPERFEAHRTYVDLQLVVSGAESVGIAPRTPCLDVVQPYDEARDIEFVRAEGMSLPLFAGQFLVIFPHEAHQPGCHPAGGPSRVRKIIVKMRLGE